MAAGRASAGEKVAGPAAPGQAAGAARPAPRRVSHPLLSSWPSRARLRGVTSARTPGDVLPAVMVDESRQDFDILHSLRAGNVESLRIMDGPDATTRYGTGFVNGIIHVTMPAGRRRP